MESARDTKTHTDMSNCRYDVIKSCSGHMLLRLAPNYGILRLSIDDVHNIDSNVVQRGWKYFATSITWSLNTQVNNNKINGPLLPLLPALPKTASTAL